MSPPEPISPPGTCTNTDDGDEPMERGFSVRTRLTFVVAVAAAVLLFVLAAVAPGMVESRLTDDLLDAEARAAASFLDFDVGAAVATGEVFVVEVPTDPPVGPGPSPLDLGVIESSAVLTSEDFVLDPELFPGPEPGAFDVVDLDGDRLADRIVDSTTGVVLADDLPSTGTIIGLPAGDPTDGDGSPTVVDLADVADGVAVGPGLVESHLDAMVGLVRSTGRLDELTDVANGPFALVSLPEDFVVVGGERPVGVADARDLGIPLLNLAELDELLFDDLAIRQLSATTFVESDGTDGRTALGVRRLDGTDHIVAADLSGVEDTVATLRPILWIAAPILVLLIGLVTWLLTGRALRPVRSITDRAATISGADLGARVPVPAAGDEITELATTMNGVLDRLEQDDRRRRRFVSDASHELRTPVAVLRNEAEVALRHPDTTRTDELAEVVAEESARMSAMIDDLLALARHDEGIAAPSSPVDLDDIVLAEAARTRRLPVSTSDVSACRVLGHVDELGRLVAHLLDNAARHAATTVEVALSNTDGVSIRLDVDDDGAGIPAGHREAVFDRFVRLDDARDRDHGGAGLGLAVVRGIAERHGGTVSVADSPLGGARLSVTLPDAP